MTVKNNNQLIKIMTLLMLVNTQSRRFGVLSIDLIIDQVKEPLLKKGLQMFVNGRDDRNIRDTLSVEIGSSDNYQNLVVEGVCMLASWANNFCISLMQEKFNIYLSTEDQIKLEVTTKEVLDDWKDHSETIEGGNQVIIEHLQRYEKWINY